MKPHTQAVREAQAWARIQAAVQRQRAAAGGKVEGLDATHRDPVLQQLFRMEALAAYLEGAGAPANEEPPAKAHKEGKRESTK